MKLVTNMGYVYRMSDRNYVKLLKAIVAGKTFNTSDFGKQLGYIEAKITDTDPEEAEYVLQSLKNAK